MIRLGKFFGQFLADLRSALLKHVAEAIIAGLVLVFGVFLLPLRTWLVTLHSVTLSGVFWLTIIVALAFVVNWTIRRSVMQRRATQSKALPGWAQAVGAKLDDLILDLWPCFEPGGNQTSIYEAFHSTQATKDDLWNQTHYQLIILGAWFKSWDSMRRAVVTRRTVEILAQQLESLNSFLYMLGLVLPDVSRRIAKLTPDDFRLVSCKAAVERYNRFLNEYEALLRRLPQEMELTPPPSLAREHVFTRL